jgi:regulator of protease activity HflC (stomatin/prohibitin superfamily)
LHRQTNFLENIMIHRLTSTAQAAWDSIRNRLGARTASEGLGADSTVAAPALSLMSRYGRPLLVIGAVGLAGWVLVKNPPVQSVPQGEIGVRVNQITGSSGQFRQGSVLMIPGIHRMGFVSLRDQTYRPQAMQRADASGALQSLEGLAVGVDLGVRYAVDPAKAGVIARNAEQSVESSLIEPAVQGVVYKIFARYTVREIFSSKRVEIQKELEKELTARLASDGILVRSVQVGKIDLPADYRRGMEGLLAEELASEKMRYTLELKEKQVKETELQATADKARREITAEAAAREQVIAAKAQEEAMKHVLPFKQRQVEQRQLEAEAERVSRLKIAQGNAEARRIEASGEADARVKLAEAEANRLDKLGKVGAEQMAREGALLSKHPLLIQKTMADKLSDKVQVIIAPPSDGGFIAAGLLGQSKRDAGLSAAQVKASDEAEEGGN